MGAELFWCADGNISTNQVRRQDQQPLQRGLREPAAGTRQGRNRQSGYAFAVSSTFWSSPDWYISRMMSAPPTNSPFT